MTAEFIPPAYSHNTTLDLLEQRRFQDLSSVEKRLLVARWVNRGKNPSDLPRLERRDQTRFVKITQEESFEVLQDILTAADALEDLQRGRRTIH